MPGPQPWSWRRAPRRTGRSVGEAWAGRPEHDEWAWAADSVSIGGEVGTIDTDGSVVFGGRVDVDLADGSVFHLDGDDFADFCHRGLEGHLEIARLAPNLPAFFARFVFGPQYPELVGLVCTGSPYRKHKRRYADPWMRLLAAADLIPPPDGGRI